MLEFLKDTLSVDGYTHFERLSSGIIYLLIVMVVIGLTVGVIMLCIHYPVIALFPAITITAYGIGLALE